MIDTIKKARMYPVTDEGDPDADMHVNTIIGRPLKDVARELDGCSPELRALVRIALTDSLESDPRLAAADRPVAVFGSRDIQHARARLVEALDAWTQEAKERRDLIRREMASSSPVPAPTP